jgi:N-acyl-D-aspartate/D-glutamate deacylase
LTPPRGCAHANQLCDASFATHLLVHWVRRKGVLTIEEEVRMLTVRPAEVFGTHDRGRRLVGLVGDYHLRPQDRRLLAARPSLCYRVAARSQPTSQT